MKRTLLVSTLVSILGIGGLVAAQATNPDDHAAHHPGAAAAPAASRADTQAAPGTMGAGMMGNGMMGGGMMGMMGGGMCPMMGGGMMGGGMMGGAKTKVDVKKIDKGVTITFTSSDAATVTRIQKMAEAMRLMHEATSQ
jgi:hypothetical protein